MTSKEYVLRQCPDVRSYKHKIKNVSGSTYWTISIGRSVEPLSEGSTELRAWVGASKKIKQQIKLNKMKELKFKHRGCSVFFTHNLSIPNIEHFVRSYLSAWLSDSQKDDFKYTPSEVKEKNELLITTSVVDSLLSIFINKELHITIVLDGFHNMQLISEIYTDHHARFFLLAHNNNLSGRTLISNMRWYNNYC